jgi:hypothetical protein
MRLSICFVLAAACVARALSVPSPDQSLKITNGPLKLVTGDRTIHVVGPSRLKLGEFEVLPECLPVDSKEADCTT